MTENSVGFIGLGVMGEPICRNMLTKSGAPFQVLDLAEAPMARLAEAGAQRAESVAALAATVDVLFLSLPGGAEVEAVITGPGGIAAHAREGLTVVDLSTAPVALTRQMAERLAALDVDYADAPVARTRQAAIDGTLSIMVGASDAVFARVRPLLDHAASDVTHCGPVGCGQVTKILNNMVLFETVVALSEALALGRSAGMDPGLLFDTLSKGSADSFALRNHGLKSMVPQAFPEGAFSTNYALKDLSYALELARDAGIVAHGAETARHRLERARDAGYGANYFPALSMVHDARPGGDGD
ncbi:2-hydroxy-3-oxopropionate reductase [Acuticoccus sediminis]|uniref:2-hydroxy-3-oxopropionate reductase n=1 Tax=Acuticoccus sediminis TaxID=2184697 RepID=A0A8B2NVB4_9HYPH|nr:NAD(P)-dependent oxidoreductase [Acuticoccus sediminis]RAI02248.1 2-hydroxy-3-oxopropionate reductase [Acuticoccus sediminis]